MTTRKAILKSSGRVYFVSEGKFCGTREDNEQKRREGKIFCIPEAYGKTIHWARIDKNGKPYGATRCFYSEQLQFIN